MDRKPRYPSKIIRRVRAREMAQVIRAARQTLDLLDVEIDRRLMAAPIYRDFDLAEKILLATLENPPSQAIH